MYLADDTKLDLQVAIKVLPEAVRQDPERRARFRREAKPGDIVLAEDA